MSNSSLHPLARQAIVLSSRTDCYGWAFGLTKYLAFRDPIGCVRWTLNFVMPHVQDTGEYADVNRRSVRFLNGVLTEPSRASLHEMDEFVWLPWNHRAAIKGAGPLARLVWAAMGAVLLTQPDNPPSSELPSLFLGDEGPRTLAEKAVWSQCATAIHLLGDDMLATLLKASGHDVRTATDGLTALESAHDFRPNAVLLDIGLPGMNGLEVAKWIRQQPTLKNAVLIAMTGYGQEADRQRSLEAGFDHHLVKPADFRKVKEILATVKMT